MPLYSYLCSNCDIEKDIYKPMELSGRREYCDCGQEMDRLFKGIGITGTRDSFGIKGKPFMHTDGNGVQKEITNWKEWERAGYTDQIPTKDKRGVDISGEVKRKIKKIKNEKKKNFSVKVK